MNARQSGRCYEPLDPSPAAKSMASHSIGYRWRDCLRMRKSIPATSRSRCAARTRLNALIVAADDYQRSGRALGDLNPLTASRLGLLPKMWLIGPEH